MKYKWKGVEGFESLYKVNREGMVLSVKTNTILKPGLVRGYHQVGLRKDGKYHHLYVHRLLAVAFIANPDNKPFINHKNGIKTDNRIINLEWCTRSENNQHAWDTKLRITRSNYNNGKAIKILQSDKNGAVIRIWNSYKEIKLAGNISSEYVRQAISGKRVGYKDSYWEIITAEVTRIDTTPVQ